MISLEVFREQAKSYQVVPLVRRLFSGTETPISVFEKLAADKPGSFLLESAEQGVWSRYSFIGVESLGQLVSENGKTRFDLQDSASTEFSFLKFINPHSALESLSAIQGSLKSFQDPELPPLISGMVGLLGWDTIHELESLGERKEKEYRVPDLAMSLIRDLVVVDHADSSLLLISNAYLSENSDVVIEYSEAVSRIEKMQKRLIAPSLPFVADQLDSAELKFKPRTSKEDFLESVDLAKVHVRAGDVFQVVISQRFDVECAAPAIDVYRTLRALNPSPYMYLLNMQDGNGKYSVVGSSPEALVRVTGSRAVLHPIAGSRPRGVNSERDIALADELAADEKEKAEHLMLVDLARNDLLKVCEPATVSVTEFMTVERYSHVMHLVSTVEGSISGGNSAVDVLRATFPAGTLSGAPKPRALEIIEALEPTNRGLFGGVVGYFDFAGNADLAIAIRTAVIRDGLAYIQAGAGIVLDSDPESEYQETLNKASAPIRAVNKANRLARLT